MIISRTPLRISFVGGGSDIIRKKQKKPGSVVSVTINKYIYVIINKKSDKKIRVSYSRTENENNIKSIKHPIVRACLDYFKIKDSIEIVTVADIPSRGSGLGSSSALTVGLLNALAKYKNKNFSKYQLSKIAYKIESKVLQKTLGYQDHFSASYGGFNYMKFYKNHKIVIKKIKLKNSFLVKLKKNILILNTGRYRIADKILKKIPSDKNQTFLDELSSFTNLFIKFLKQKNIEELGKILDLNWNVKKKLDKNICNKEIDEIYKISKQKGAIGGKILGAGGGGYFLIMAKPKFHKKIKNSLKKYLDFHFNFEYSGTTIIYNSNKHNLKNINQ